jgi:enamine deaminase RidA (YjgF/YER057c/UK114 family)
LFHMGNFMQRQLISSGSPFEGEIGYSRAVVQGPFVFISGTTGFDYTTMTIEDDVVAQAEQCFKNIEAVLLQTGATFADVIKATYVIPEASDVDKCFPVFKKYFGEVRPAIMILSAQLLDQRMKIEIEITALKQL